MWPPSSGRNGKRLIRPSERLTTATSSSVSGVLEFEFFVGDVADADDAGELLALLLFEEPGEDRDGPLGRRAMSESTASAAAPPAPRSAWLAPVPEADPGRVPVRASYVGVSEIVFTWPSRRTVSVTGVSARAALDLLAGALWEAMSSPNCSSRGIECQIGVAMPVDRDDSSPGCRAAAAGDPGSIAPTLWVVVFEPVLEEDEEQDRQGDRDVHRRPGADHDDPLPDRLVVVGAGRDLGRKLLLGVHPGDFHEAARGDRPDPVLGLAPFERDQLRREEEEEALDPHPGRLGGEEVPGLVEDDQRREAEEDQDPVHTAANPAICSSVRRRASSSMAKRSSKWVTGRAGISSRTPRPRRRSP